MFSILQAANSKIKLKNFRSLLNVATRLEGLLIKPHSLIYHCLNPSLAFANFARKKKQTKKIVYIKGKSFYHTTVNVEIFVSLKFLLFSNTPKKVKFRANKKFEVGVPLLTMCIYLCMARRLCQNSF